MSVGKDDVAFLESIATPTVCNVIEIVALERHGHGYTTRHLHCAFPDLPPKVGFGKTVTMRVNDPMAARAICKNGSITSITLHRSPIQAGW
jgi:hypothetical protein